MSLLVLVLLGACSSEHASVDVRYSLDVAFDVDGERVVGSSVYDLVMSSGGGSGDGTISRVVTKFKGEAIVVPFSGRPTLVILMTSGNKDAFRELFLYACGINIAKDETLQSYFGRIAAVRGPCEVKLEWLKILGIGDPSDPKAFRLADSNDLAPTFGSGIRIVSASVSKSDQPVTSGIRAMFPWIPRHGEWQQPGSVLSKVSVGIDLTADLFALGDT
ncbi:MAG: hypothetical protein JNL14_20060 [Devosia sp.]|uniref:hypothetical protein n=1 Tax=Devosia sp. TaxID=1871048 RepID=UPI001A5D95E3|nr:hypothetical protein [Devosia sp.]MBL8600038.1 hypothetical protein [Devosia sp.]